MAERETDVATFSLLLSCFYDFMFWPDADPTDTIRLKSKRLTSAVFQKAKVVAAE